MDWQTNELCKTLALKVPNFKVQVVPTIDSTNTELMRRAKQGLFEPGLLVAEQQTAGKGRLGRTWYARMGETLTFSIGLPLFSKDWSGLSLAVGVAILTALDPSGQSALGLKWPNDLWLGPVQRARKLGGILIESTPCSQGNLSAQPARYCVIGVGINVVAPANPDLQRAPAGMTELDAHASVASILQVIAPQILENVLRFDEDGFAIFQKEYAKKDILLGQQISMSNGVVGRAGGVNDRGELMIQTQSGMVAVHSDEVSLTQLGE
jgi:BirA family biotin operon repressor/biotin-[acetyl-CoA-carboxylase] ligase